MTHQDKTKIKRRRRRILFWLFAAAAVCALLLEEQVAVLYVLSTLAICRLMIVVAFSNLEGRDAQMQTVAIRASREWFAHDPNKWKKFRGRYETEIGHNHDLIKVLKDEARKGTITLIYGARDEKHNEALVLKQFLERNH